jgi:hypothetical protein
MGVHVHDRLGGEDCLDRVGQVLLRNRLVAHFFDLPDRGQAISLRSGRQAEKPGQCQKRRKKV